MITKRLPIIERHGWWLLETDRGVSEFLARNEPYEPHIARRCAQLDMDGTIALDIGANVGAHTVTFAELVGDTGIVYAFEPQHIVYLQLCANVVTRGLVNVWPGMTCIGEKTQAVKIETRDFTETAPVNIGDTHVSAEGQDVMMFTLDDILALEDKRRVSVIKLDIQGYELFALQGGERRIMKDRPEIFIEIEPPHLTRFGLTDNDVLRWLEEHNYACVRDHDYDWVASPR